MDDDEIEDAIEDSTQELVANEQVLARYETLVALWIHRDTTAHQWAPLIISASAAVLAIVFSQKTPEQMTAIAGWRNWGEAGNVDVSIGAGMPVLFTGLLVLPFVYALYRSIQALDSLALIIIEMERDLLSTPAHARFTAVTRPPGWSARQLVKRALACMSFSMIVLGSLMTFGIYGGVILSALIGAISVLFVQSDRFASRVDNAATAARSTE
jgi:hypothetical protein